MEIRLECQKMNEECDQLKSCEPEVMTCGYHMDSAKNEHLGTIKAARTMEQ